MANISRALKADLEELLRQNQLINTPVSKTPIDIGLPARFDSQTPTTESEFKFNVPDFFKTLNSTSKNVEKTLLNTLSQQLSYIGIDIKLSTALSLIISLIMCFVLSIIK